MNSQPTSLSRLMQYNPMLLWDMKLKDKDGTVLSIRPITLQDTELEKEFFKNLSKESMHYRFLGGVSELSSEVLADLCNVDYFHDMAFVAVIKGGSGEKIVAVVRYAEDADGSRNAEIAVTVADEWQNKGIGTELLKRLVGFARLAGIKKLYSIDSYANDKMRLLAKEFDFTRAYDPEDASLVIYQLDIAD